MIVSECVLVRRQVPNILRSSFVASLEPSEGSDPDTDRPSI